MLPIARNIAATTILPELIAIVFTIIFAIGAVLTWRKFVKERDIVGNTNIEPSTISTGDWPPPTRATVEAPKDPPFENQLTYKLVMCILTAFTVWVGYMIGKPFVEVFRWTLGPIRGGMLSPQQLAQHMFPLILMIISMASIIAILYNGLRFFSLRLYRVFRRDALT